MYPLHAQPLVAETIPPAAPQQKHCRWGCQWGGWGRKLWSPCPGAAGSQVFAVPAVAEGAAAQAHAQPRAVAVKHMAAIRFICYAPS
jgi:hypothetical protein